MSVAHQIPCFSLFNIHWVVLDTFKLSCSTCVVCYSDIADWRHDAVLSCIFMTIVPHNKTAMTGFSLFFVLYLFVQEYIETCEKKGSKGPRIQGSKNSRKLSERTMWIIISNFHILFVLSWEKCLKSTLRYYIWDYEEHTSI